MCLFFHDFNRKLNMVNPKHNIFNSQSNTVPPGDILIDNSLDRETAKALKNKTQMISLNTLQSVL